MLRLAASGAGVALLCAAAYLIGRQPGPPLGSDAGLVALLSAPALLISLVAAIAALRAAAVSARLKRDIVLLARSIDIALKEIVARNDRNDAAVSELAASVAQEVERLSGRIGEARETDTPPPPAPDNVVPHPSLRRGGAIGRAGDHPSPLPDPGAVAAACRKALARGHFDLALHPIVSVTSGMAAGFEVFASLPLESGAHIELGHPPETIAPNEAAAFERILIATALQAGRRCVGAGPAMPLHVAVSDALLSDSKALGAVLDMLQYYPDLAGCLVLSMPHALLRADGLHRQALEMIAAEGVRFAAEGRSEGAEAAASLPGPVFLKIAAGRLLDREQSSPRSPSGLAIIATGVGTDEDAVSLRNLGVELMSGPRFGARLLRPDDHDVARGLPARL